MSSLTKSCLLILFFYTTAAFLVDDETQKLCACEPKTCRDVHSDNPRKVTVLANGLEVMCDTQTDDGGWLVFQRRTGPELNFTEDWANYKHGFGTVIGDQWLGLEKLYQLTN